MTGEAEHPLETWGSGDDASQATRRGEVVLRTAGPWSATVLALLAHFESVGFTGAPRVVGEGFDPAGRETLTYLPGTSPHPHAWSDDALTAIGELLRQAHDAAATFTPPAHATWKPWFGRELGGTHPVIGHGDVAPWNLLSDARGPHALIDWEFAGPVDATWELAQAAWLNAQLHDDDIAEQQDLPPAVNRAAQVRLLLDGYGLPAGERVGFVDKMIEIAIHSARAEAGEHMVTADTTRAVSATGYPVLWAITWRTRSASWMLRNRPLLEHALT